MIVADAQIELLRFNAEPKPCPYLPGEVSSLEYRYILNLHPNNYEELLVRGWRRFGLTLFRPACAQCSKCVSLRVPVSTFKPSKTHRRILRQNEHLRLAILPPSVSEDHLRLWNDYHAYMSQVRGWKSSEITAPEYIENFVLGAEIFGKQFLYYDGEKLVAVGLVDCLPNSLSSVYFFHDPAYRDRSLGIYSMLVELQFARENGLLNHYLGYWVEGCPSMNYKAQYKPHELLDERPQDGSTPSWVAH